MATKQSRLKDLSAKISFLFQIGVAVVPPFYLVLFHKADDLSNAAIPLFFSFLMLSVMPHELAHAWVGRRLGLSVKEISVGRGQTMFSFPLLGFKVIVHSFLFVGCVEFVRINGKGLRWRYFLMVMAGPISHLVLALLSVVLLRLDFCRAHFMYPLYALIISQAFLFFGNLLPNEFQTARGLTRSDGYNLLDLLFAKYPTLIFAPTKFYYNWSDNNTPAMSSTFTKTG